MRSACPPKDAWTPLSVADASAVFDAAPFRWWIAGGHALDLHLGRQWRAHEDTDIGIVRDQTGSVYRWLVDWSLCVAASGQLSSWHGEPLAPERGENNIWGRRNDELQWSIDLTVGSGDREHWVFRRDPSIRRPWDTAVLRSPVGVPYLAPDLQLLFKSKGPRPKDDRDAAEVIPTLTDAERQFLGGALPSRHPWSRLLAG